VAQACRSQESWMAGAPNPDFVIWENTNLDHGFRAFSAVSSFVAAAFSEFQTLKIQI
jgi:hypothetical protein